MSRKQTEKRKYVTKRERVQGKKYKKERKKVETGMYKKGEIQNIYTKDHEAARGSGLKNITIKKK